jgi:hypothetical protein
MRRKASYIILLPGLLVLLAACQVTQSAFTRTASNAGSAFAAASATLTYAHEGKITATYAWSSFMNYQSELSGLDQQLSSQQGVPDAHTLQHLLALYKSAMQAVDAPCLDQSCNWRAQVAILDRASKAFQDAGDQ